MTFNYVRKKLRQHFSDGKCLLNFEEADELIKQAENDLFSANVSSVVNENDYNIELSKAVEAFDYQAADITNVDNTFYEFGDKDSLGFDFDKRDGVIETAANGDGWIEAADTATSSSAITPANNNMTHNMIEPATDPNSNTNKSASETSSTSAIQSEKTTTASVKQTNTTIRKDDSSLKTHDSAVQAEHSGGEDDLSESILSVEPDDNIQLPQKRKLIFNRDSSDSSDSSDDDKNKNSDSESSSTPCHRTRPENKTKCVCKGGCKTVVSTDIVKFCEKPNRLYNTVCHGECKKTITTSLMKAVGQVYYCNNVGIFNKNKTPVCTYVICATCHVKKYEGNGGRRTRRSIQ